MSHLHMVRDAVGYVVLISVVTIILVAGTWPVAFGALKFVLETLSNV